VLIYYPTWLGGLQLKKLKINRTKVMIFYAVEDRTPRVYPWMNEPGGGIFAG
jgi:hypothetical protein